MSKQAAPYYAPAICDESGVGFAASLAENSTALWSHHSFLRSDGTWLSEWSDGMGERSGARSPVAWVPGASKSWEKLHLK